MTNEDFQKIVLEKLVSLETKVDSIHTHLENVEGQVKENNRFVVSLVHITEELNAKYDRLLNITASEESIERIEIKIEEHTNNIEENTDRLASDVTFLVRKSGEPKSDIHNLELKK